MGSFFSFRKRFILYSSYSKTYRLYWFDKDSYRTFYSPEGDLEEVIVIYPYKVKSNKGFGGSQVGLNTDKRYMRLRITAETIEETHSEQELSFDNPAEFTTINKKTLDNTMRVYSLC